MSAAATKVRCPSCATALRCQAPASPEQTVKCPRCGLLFALSEALPGPAATQTDVPERNQQTIDLPAGERGDSTMRLPPEEGEEAEDRTLNTTGEQARPVVEPPDTLALETPTLKDDDEEGLAARRRSSKTLRAAVVEIDDEEEEPLPRKKKRRREEGGIEIGKLLAVAAAVVLIGGASAAAVWFFALKDRPNQTAQGAPAPPPDTVLPPPPGGGRVLPDLPGNDRVVGTEVGNLAPEISGEMLSGMAYNLSDFRGKVVLLDFWGDWCPYCRSCYGVEKDLVLKLGGRPFVMLGVNSDRTKDLAREGVQRDELNWDSWYDGRRGTIAERWEVDGFPSFFLIDHRGVIRKKFSGADKKELGKLFAEAEELVRDAEAARR